MEYENDDEGEEEQEEEGDEGESFLKQHTASIVVPQWIILASLPCVSPGATNDGSSGWKRCPEQTTGGSIRQAAYVVIALRIWESCRAGSLVVLEMVAQDSYSDAMTCEQDTYGGGTMDRGE